MAFPRQIQQSMDIRRILHQAPEKLSDEDQQVPGLTLEPPDSAPAPPTNPVQEQKGSCPPPPPRGPFGLSEEDQKLFDLMLTLPPSPAGANIAQEGGGRGSTTGSAEGVPEYPSWARGDSRRRLEAQATVRKNYVEAEPCAPCREAGVTCYRNRDHPATRCARCRTVAKMTRGDCVGA